MPQKAAFFYFISTDFLLKINIFQQKKQSL